MTTLTFSNNNKDLPYITLLVHGQPQTFLLDSGADATSMTTAHYEGPLSSQIINSVGISGTDIPCPVTPPLEVRAPGLIPFFHKFTIIPGAPLNLLGRDLIEAQPHECRPRSEMPQAVETRVDPSLWSQYKDDTGFIDMEPYRAKLKTNKPVYFKQYPLSKDKELGIQPVIESFIQQGVLADGKTWRLTQDLRAINQLITPLAPIVPDVQTVINCIPCTHKYFTVIDLCAAFFSVPVHPDTQPLLAFTFQGKQLAWTRLAQGYVDSPAVFSAAVQRTLAKMTDLPSTVCVLQYADDILISGETKDDCEHASIIVCNVLAQAGFKASRDKLQWVQSKVTYLGHIIMPGLRAISTDRVQLIRKMKSNHHLIWETKIR
uniref:ribonuclease H n=1 Tax=Cyprinus carpio TaxID=7962 RepID=A0A8C1PUS6_CYPCA